MEHCSSREEGQSTITHNLVIQIRRAKGSAKTVKKSVESWKLLFDNQIVSEMFNQTNEEIIRKKLLMEIQGTKYFHIISTQMIRKFWL